MGLMNLPHPEPPEIALQGHTTLVIPLSVRNRTGKTQEISLAASMPGRMDGTERHRKIHRGGKTGGRRADRSLVARGSRKRNEEAGPEEISVHANSNEQTIGR